MHQRHGSGFLKTDSDLLNDGFQAQTIWRLRIFSLPSTGFNFHPMPA
jgi:hypothetical protein